MRGSAIRSNNMINERSWIVKVLISIVRDSQSVFHALKRSTYEDNGCVAFPEYNIDEVESLLSNNGQIGFPVGKLLFIANFSGGRIDASFYKNMIAHFRHLQATEEKYEVSKQINTALHELFHAHQEEIHLLEKVIVGVGEEVVNNNNTAGKSRTYIHKQE